MTTPTTHFRHVWRDISDGNSVQRVLALQQWHAAEGWEHPDYVAAGGYWEDVPLCTNEREGRPDA